MAVFQIKCDCGQSVSVNVGDKIWDNRIWWFQSYHCDNCDKTVELDSMGEIPIKIEQIIMEQDGTYALFSDDSKDRVKIEFIIKKGMADNLRKFELFLEKKSDEIIRGTQNEVLIVKSYLEKKGISSRIVKLK